MLTEYSLITCHRNILYELVRVGIIHEHNESSQYNVLSNEFNYKLKEWFGRKTNKL